MTARRPVLPDTAGETLSQQSLQAQKGAVTKSRQSQKPKSGFAAINWAEIDPDNPPEKLKARFAHSVAAKRQMGWTAPGPMDDETTTAYVASLWERKVRAAHLADEQSKDAALPLQERLTAFNAAVEEKLAVYAQQYLNMQPNDLAGFRELCRIELQMEESSKTLAITPRAGETDLRLRSLLLDEWQKLNVQYRELQRVLNISKLQRDQNVSERQAADIVGDAITGTALWMEQHMRVLRCRGTKQDGKPCNTELAWVWWAFDEVHDPSPFVFLGKCALCGTICEAGDKAAFSRKKEAA